LVGKLLLFLLAAAALTACAPREDTSTPSKAGLVRLPCRSEAHLKVANDPLYCMRDRNWVTPRGQAVMRDVADEVAQKHPGSVVMYMEASWPSGKRPMPPHLSHGDGRQIDVALFYQSLEGKPLPRPPNPAGYFAYEPPRPSDPRPCKGVKRPGPNDDPPKDRKWRLDEERTRDLIRALLADKRVRRLLLEPHLKRRLGFADDPRIRFLGCNTMRHDSHVHVDIR
jgi:murein endopeptidase